MALSDAFSKIEAINKQIVFANTWGHLYPETHRKYNCFIVVAKGVCSDSIIFDYGFEGLQDSPWLFNDFTEFSFSATDKFKAPCLCCFQGWYKKFKNGNYLFGGGKFTKVGE